MLVTRHDVAKAPKLGACWLRGGSDEGGSLEKRGQLWGQLAKRVSRKAFIHAGLRASFVSHPLGFFGFEAGGKSISLKDPHKRRSAWKRASLPLIPDVWNGVLTHEWSGHRPMLFDKAMKKPAEAGSQVCVLQVRLTCVHP